jgi:GT2 family glycosyltransferase
MRLSIVIPAYNHLDKVLRCVNSLSETFVGVRAFPTPSFDLLQFVIQDDASPDYDYRPLIRHQNTITNRNEVNLGFNGNVNAAVSFTDCDIVAIINQDVFAVPQLSDGWDLTLINAFDDPQVGIVGPKLLFPNGTIQSAGGSIDAKGQPYHRCLGYSDITYHEVNTPQDVDWVTGAFLVIRRTLWDALGGFDAIYAPSYFEDADLCLRAREAGFRVWYEPRATFIHEVGSTGGSPHFGRSAMAFKSRWVDTGRLRPTEAVIKERFW